MSLIGETDELHNHLGSISLHSDKTVCGVGSSLCSFASDAKAVTESDASGNAICGSFNEAAPTESDAVPCCFDLREDEPSSIDNERQLSEINTNGSRELPQPSLSRNAPTLSPSSRRKYHQVPVEQAQPCPQETGSSTTMQSRRAHQSLGQGEPIQIQRRPERVKEEPEFFDVAMIYCQEDKELAKKFGEVLQKFIILDGQQKPKIYLDFLDLRDSLGGNKIELFDHVLSCSSYAFVFFSPKSVNSEDLKGKYDRSVALHGSITDKNCANVVLIVTEPKLKLGYSFGACLDIDLQSLLLGGRILDLVSVNDLKMEHIDRRTLDFISSLLNNARAKRHCKVTNCRVSNFEQSYDAKQSTAQSVYHKERIRENFDDLVDCMELDYGLLTYLFSKQVLSDREMESITAEKTRYEKNEKLLNLLYLKDAKSFEKFVCGLSESSQGHLAKRLHDPMQK